MLLRTLALVIALSGAVACGHTPVWHSPSTIPLEPGSYSPLGWVKGQDCHWTLLGILPLSNSSETHVAIRDAIDEMPGADAMVNVTTDTFLHWYVLFFRSCIEVDGFAVRTR